MIYEVMSSLSLDMAKQRMDELFEMLQKYLFLQ